MSLQGWRLSLVSGKRLEPFVELWPPFSVGNSRPKNLAYQTLAQTMIYILTAGHLLSQRQDRPSGNLVVFFWAFSLLFIIFIDLLCCCCFCCWSFMGYVNFRLDFFQRPPKQPVDGKMVRDGCSEEIRNIEGLHTFISIVFPFARWRLAMASSIVWGLSDFSLIYFTSLRFIRPLRSGRTKPFYFLE